MLAHFKTSDEEIASDSGIDEDESDSDRGSLSANRKVLITTRYLLFEDP